MKHICLILASFTMTCSAFYFQQRESRNLDNIIAVRQSLSKELKSIADDLCFINHHAQDLSFLEKKGWFHPQSRLIAAEKIKDATASLNKISFTFEPESIEEHKDGYSFKINRIVFQTSAVLDTFIYEFIHKIIKSFPGILILRKLSLTRNEALNTGSFSALPQSKPPDCIQGEIIFEWISMGKEKNAP